MLAQVATLSLLLTAQALDQSKPDEPALRSAIESLARNAMAYELNNMQSSQILSLKIDTLTRIPDAPHFRKGRYKAEGQMRTERLKTGYIDKSKWEAIFCPGPPKPEILKLIAILEVGGKLYDSTDWFRLLAPETIKEIQQSWSENEVKIAREARRMPKRSAATYLGKQRNKFKQSLIAKYNDLPSQAVLAVIEDDRKAS